MYLIFPVNINLFNYLGIYFLGCPDECEFFVEHERFL